MTHQLHIRGDYLSTWGWPGIMGAVTLSGSIAFACMMPFATIATLAAGTTRLRQGLAVVALCWLGNQALGFGLLGYPRDWPTLLNGISLLAATGGAYAVARLTGRGTIAGLLPTGIFAFAAFESVLFAYAAAQGDLAMFAPDIVALVGLNEMVWLAVLVGLAAALERLLPGWLALSRRWAP